MDLDRCPQHKTPLNFTKISSRCEACYKDGHDNKQGYKCDFCDFYVHEECINLDIPSRHKHPLKLTRNDTKCECCLCESDELALLYECSQCDFRICIQCVRRSLIFNESRWAHKHKLQQVPMKLSFTCDACGLFTSACPCICQKCCFIVHRGCISLPHVININRHDHRISHVSSLGPGNWICGVCHKPINAAYGAYSCLICYYAVHSLCIMRDDIWDGEELQGISEEEKEESKPFEVIDQNLIKHFSHQHNMKVSLGLEEDKHCYACTLHFNSERCYRCIQCDFILHDACANLPLRKRHPFSRRKLTLCTKVQHDNSSLCIVCLRYCNGFSYAGDYGQIDVKCASITDAFKHESHPHWLFPFIWDFSSIRRDVMPKCKVCGLLQIFYLRCINQDDCGGFTLCFRCATLPILVRHKYDDHLLSLLCGAKNEISMYWCGICEKELNANNWFYWCHDCDSTLHTDCVFKNLLHTGSGYTFLIRYEGTFDLLPNDSLSRPTCYKCNSRCMGDLVLNNKGDRSIFMCTSCGFIKKTHEDALN